jgi:hypothetical protein
MGEAPVPVIELGLDVAVKVVAVAPKVAAVYVTVAVVAPVVVAVPIVGELGIAALALPTAKDKPVLKLLVVIKRYYLRGICLNYTIILALQTSQTLIY